MLVGLCFAATADEPLGVTLDGGQAVFRVWAPNARSVAVAGSFNSGRPGPDDQLVKDEATGIWSGAIPRSRANGEYRFLINNELPRRDPYGRLVSPDGAWTRFYDTGRFDWSGDRAPAYPLEDTIIYEMHIGTFNDPKANDGVPGTFDDAIKRLDYLVDLGVNTLCILPVAEFNGKHSWGYNPSDPFAVEQAYGGPDGLKRFVRECHRRGLAVHLDIVHNHYGPQNLHLTRFDGTGGHDSGGIYFYEGPGISMTPWGPRPDFGQPMVRRYVRDNVFMWLEEYRIDGFRWDSTINIRAYDNGARAIPDGARMLEDINDEIRRRFPGRWSIAEDSYGIGNFDASWDYDFHHQVMPALSARDDGSRNIHQLNAALLRQKTMPRVIYVDNHDEAGRLNGQRRIASDIHPSRPGDPHARKLCGIGALLTFTAPGIPLLFMGNEFQEYGDFHDDTALDWSKTRLHAGTLQLHRDLIALRLDRAGRTGGLKGNGIEAPLVDDQRNQIAYWRWHEANPADVTVVAVNLSHQPADMNVPFPLAGRWVQHLDTDWVRYGGDNRIENVSPFALGDDNLKPAITMAPYSAKVFSLVNRPPAGASRTSARPAARVRTDRPPVSMYAAIHLVGNVNDGDLTAWPFALVEDSVWEGTFTFRGAMTPRFKLSANDNGVINWGNFERGPTLADGASVGVKRLGSEFVADGPWDGTYLLRFHEELLTLDITRTGDAAPETEETAAEPEGIDGFRTWTDNRGATLEARLIEVAGIMVALERRDGRRIQIPLARLSEDDRAFLDFITP